MTIKIYKNRYFYILILILVFFGFAPNYIQAAEGLYSAKAKVSWSDGGNKTNEKRAYIFTGETKNYFKYLNDVGPILYPLEDRQLGYPGLDTYACQKNSGPKFTINAGLSKMLPKGWYMMIPEPPPGQPDDPNLLSSPDFKSKLSAGFNWGAATVSWGGQQDYERNCDYEYMYLPLSSRTSASALIEGDIYAGGEISETTTDPNKNYLAIVGQSTVESLSDIAGFDDDDITKVGLYQINSQSTSSKENINKFRMKLDKFISQYYNVRYGKDTPNGANQFLKSNIDTELRTPTDSAKNPDGDMYVIDGDLTIDSEINLPKNARKLVYVEGNLYIKANINGFASDPDSSVLAFVVDGDIVVDGNIINAPEPGYITFYSGFGVSNIIPVQNFTLELYFKAPITSQNSYLVSSYKSGKDSYYFNIDSTGRIWGLVQSNSISENITTASGYNDNLWHHLALVHDSVAGKNRIYIDGNLKNSGNSTITSTLTPVNAFSLASLFPYGPVSDYNGSIAQLRLSDQVLYNSNFTPPDRENSIWPVDSSTKGYWPFNEGGGSVAYDLSGNNNHFNLSGYYVFVGGSPVFITQDVEKIQAGLISLNGTVTFQHINNDCDGNPNHCRLLDIKGLVVGDYVVFNRQPEIITFDNPKSFKAGVFIKYNPKISKLPAFDQLLADPSVNEGSP